MPPSSSKAGPEFRYPPVQADRSLTSLDLDTLMMKSTTCRLQEEPGSSLDDSTYELLTDSLIETSDDEAHTASIASASDDHTQDDGSIFGDDDDDDDDDFATNYRALDASIQSMHAAAADDDLETPLETGGEDSMLTMVPDHMNGSGGSRMVQLDEEPTADPEVSFGTTIVRTFPTQTEELPKVLETYGQPQVQLGVKASLSSRYITTPESYKILYLGLPEQWVQDNITHHIHAALTASPSKTRSVMVRGQMEPLGTVIDTYRCTKLEVTSPDIALSPIQVHIDDGRRIKIDRQRKPKFDLVILCHTQKRDYATGAQSYDSLRTALRQHSTPMIELSEIKPYGAGNRTYDMQSLVACIEGRSDDEAEFDLLEVLPLDVFSFCELEPAQINRHLALISPHLLPQTVDVSQNTQLSAVSDTVRAIGKQLRTGAPAPTKVLFLSIALTAMLSVFVLSPVYLPLLQQRFADVAPEPPMLSVSPASSLSITSAAVGSSSTASVSLSLPSSISVPKGLTVAAPQAEQPKPKSKLDNNKKNDKTKGFEIQTAGEKQFILTPSKELASSRKTPQLQIQVFRNTTLIPVLYVRTITGEYFVDLEDEYPFGSFNVSIASYSKPLLHQSFEVTLGHNKTWFDQMLGKTTNKIMDAKSILRHISSSAAEQLQAKFNDIAGDKVGHWVEEGRHLEESIYGNAKGCLESGTEFVKHVPETTLMGLRKATAPVRLSQTLWKARLNALRIRCNAETAIGRFWKLSDEQASRACSELHSLGQKGEA
ncbi:uncharacterized protein M421DRAFT_421420 [Didymella exigua CBS 183.55]|uniref:Uncharacterized protein n=1 Tax=Didymella exigua CBS 183.55 TaxID=1150837 RepID=A0A6A5RKD8_9PLEO|nr:uncharacterized protein M421DRAFT_421420 [Didymella exigua CBS 183.55]KAF1927578.1 hypothetical protein M421DRAFT_421420 [Didymella exigua CBS 183.55]